MSIAGMITGMPEPDLKRYMRSTSNKPVTVGLLSSIRQALAVVPPMSKDISRSSPRRSAKWLATRAPAAGPDSTMRTGKRLAVSVPSTPPLLIMISGAPGKPRSACARVSRSR